MPYLWPQLILTPGPPVMLQLPCSMSPFLPEGLPMCCPSAWNALPPDLGISRSLLSFRELPDCHRISKVVPDPPSNSTSYSPSHYSALFCYHLPVFITPGIVSHLFIGLFHISLTPQKANSFPEPGWCLTSNTCRINVVESMILIFTFQELPIPSRSQFPFPFTLVLMWKHIIPSRRVSGKGFSQLFLTLLIVL